MVLSHEQLCRLIPHHGKMCLLDSVIEWDDEGIHCRAVSQRATDNPLREDNRLPAIAGVEYAAQAMAVHGALLASSAESPQVAYLAALRGVELHCDTLHQERELFLHCQRLAGDSNGFIYTFKVDNGIATLLQGRATVIKPNTPAAGTDSHD